MMKSTRMYQVVVGAVALAVATSAISQTRDYSFVVGVTNNTTTPTVQLGEGAIVPEGHLQVNCGGATWRQVPKATGGWFALTFECYPSSGTGPFTLTYKARLANDGNGNAVYHEGTVTINCRRVAQGSDPAATSGTFTLTGSGTSIVASAVNCSYPQPDPDSTDSSG